MSPAFRSFPSAGLLAGLLVLLAPGAAWAASESSLEALARGLDGQAIRLAQEPARRDSLLKVIRNRLGEARRAGDRRATALLLHAEGSVYEAADELGRRDSVSREGLGLAASERDTLLEVRFLYRIAEGGLRRSSPDSARQLRGAAEALARRIGSKRWIAEARFLEASDAFRAGRMAEAESLYRVVLPRAGYAGDWARAAECYSGIAVTSAVRGDPASARAQFDSALVLARRAGHLGAEAGLLANLVTLDYFNGRYEEAFARCRDLERLARRAGVPRYLGYALERLASLSSQQGRQREAIEYADSLVALGRRLGEPDLLARGHNQRAGVLRALGRHADATTDLRATLALGDRFDARLRLPAFTALALSLVELDSLARAEQVLTDALALPAASSPLAATTLRLARGAVFFKSGRMREAAREFAGVRKSPASATYPDQAIRADIGRARALHALGDVTGAESSLDDAERLWQSARQSAGDRRFRDSMGELGHGITAERLRIELPPRDAVVDSGAGLARDGRGRRALQLIEATRAVTLLERLRGPAGKDTVEWAVPELPAAHLEEPGTMRDGELLLSAFVSTDTSIAVLTGSTGARTCALPRFDERLTERVRTLHRLLGTRPADRDTAMAHLLEPLLRGLATDLFGPLGDPVSRSRTLFVSLDDVLHLLPVDLLLRSLAGAEEAAVPQVAYVPSATILALVRSRGPASAATAPESLLALQGPAPSSVERALPGARHEVEWLADRYRLVEAVAPGTREENARWADRAVLHFAAHARGDDEAPWRSGILLGRPEDRARDGYVHAAQIASMRLGDPLVVLASCRTAVSGIYSGEGAVGLATAFLVAGSPTVVATLWEVDDRVTETLMREFYGALARGASAGEALRVATAKLRRDPRTQDPYYWAGFVLVGDPATHVELVERPVLERRGTRLALAVAALAILAAAALLWRRAVSGSPRSAA